MKSFYNLPNYIQWILAVVLILIGLGITMPFLVKPHGLLLIPLLIPIFNLFSVPIFRLLGVYKYLNPYVISTIQTDKEYDLHNVFTFDYLVNFKWSHRGTYVQKTLLASYFKALLTIIERIENKELSPEVKIVGRSYFFSDRTAERLGFKISDASFFYKLNSVIQIVELSALFSFSKGKLAIPKLWKVKKAEISGSDLLSKKEILEALVKKILKE